MVIYGVDRKFKLTVGAYKKIAELLPNGRIEELSTALSADDPFQIMDMIFNMAVIMNDQFEKQMSFIDRSYVLNPPLTVAELETLPINDVVGQLKDEIVQSIVDSQKTEINVKKNRVDGTNE